VKDYDDRTPLHLAAAEGRLNVSLFLYLLFVPLCLSLMSLSVSLDVSLCLFAS
jgi:ankyrin repeat protein